jgi:hypothetical protein
MSRSNSESSSSNKSKPISEDNCKVYVSNIYKEVNKLIYLGSLNISEITFLEIWLNQILRTKEKIK